MGNENNNTSNFDLINESPIVYQIYPRSFARSENGDDKSSDDFGGVTGNFAGVIEKLPYLKKNNVDVLWFSPINESPMKDGGYDVSNYREVNPEFGTKDEFKKLLDETHKLGMKLIIDFVGAHTSNEHEWFQKYLAGDKEFKDFYVEAKPNEETASPYPNNWMNCLTNGPAWTPRVKVNAETGKDEMVYTANNFLPEQPLLNVNNEKVQKALMAEMEYLTDLGVDGFRLDAFLMMGFNPDLPNNPRKGHGDVVYNTVDFTEQYATKNQRHLLKGENAFSKQIAEFAKRKDIFIITETEVSEGRIKIDKKLLNDEKLAKAVRQDIESGWIRMSPSDRQKALDIFDKKNNEEMTIAINKGGAIFSIMQHRTGKVDPFSKEEKGHDGIGGYSFSFAWAGDNLTEFLAGAIACSKQTDGENKGKMTGLAWATGNHDANRMRNRVLGENPSDELTKTLQKLYLSLPGPLCVYNGDELGLPQVVVPEHSRVDPCLNNRDGCRVPIPWDNKKPNMGFCSADDEPFLPTNLIDERYAVSAQEKDKNSVLNSYRQYSDFRKNSQVMQKGGINLIEVGEKAIFFEREFEGKKVLCGFNLSKDYDYVLKIDLENGKKASDYANELRAKEVSQRPLDVYDSSIRLPPEGCFVIECPPDFNVKNRSVLESLNPDEKIEVLCKGEGQRGYIKDMEIRAKIEKNKNNYKQQHAPCPMPAGIRNGRGF